MSRSSHKAPAEGAGDTHDLGVATVKVEAQGSTKDKSGTGTYCSNAPKSSHAVAGPSPGLEVVVIPSGTSAIAAQQTEDSTSTSICSGPAGTGKRSTSLDANSVLALRVATGLQPQGESAPTDRAWKRCKKHIKQHLRAIGIVVRLDFRIVVFPLLLLLICLGLGLYAHFTETQKQETQRIHTAAERASDKAQAIDSELRATYLPVKILAAFVTRILDFQQMNGTFFVSLASELVSLTNASTAVALQLAPFGIISAVYPLAGNERAMGFNLLTDPRQRDATLRTVELGNLTMLGPNMLVQGYRGCPVRYPIFVKHVDENATFGLDGQLEYLNNYANCSACYNAVTRTKLWGFATVLINWELFAYKAVKIQELRQQGYYYRLTRPNDTDPSQEVLVEGLKQGLNSAYVSKIQTPNAVWSLEVIDARGWEPEWKWAVFAAVIILSFILSLLVFAVMVGRAQQRLLLVEVMNSNRCQAEAMEMLQKEKQRTDTLLARQYNLIACLEAQPAINSEGDSRLNDFDLLRRQLMASNAVSGSGMGGLGGGDKAVLARQQIQIHELLGEGTFGKVFKGTWHGTQVAVKTIVLPDVMSGKAKREKMALMEAIISSSLAHPNVVATYTYDIRMVKDGCAADDQAHPARADSDSCGSGSGSDGEGIKLLGPEDHQLAAAAVLLDSPNSKLAVYSYEVRLVLEFCDKGCLRTALDAGALFGECGLNYRAILDTAADIAKAMLHLHHSNVLHGDLKSTNVMLKSCGSEGRGVIAKVADFGLSIKMEHTATHVSSTFQGTLTHMAPEVLLQGQVSKAADVYAFGVTLWEIFTSGQPYQGTPCALLGHQISQEGIRPTFPLGTPTAYRELAERCWDKQPAKRPTFDDILAVLTQARQELDGPTPKLADLTPPKVQRKLTDKRISALAIERARGSLGNGASKSRIGSQGPGSQGGPAWPVGHGRAANASRSASSTAGQQLRNSIMSMNAAKQQANLLRNGLVVVGSISTSRSAINLEPIREGRPSDEFDTQSRPVASANFQATSNTSTEQQ